MHFKATQWQNLSLDTCDCQKAIFGSIFMKDKTKTEEFSAGEVLS